MTWLRESRRSRYELAASLPTGVVYETMQATARITDGDMSEASIGTGGRDTVSEGQVAMFPVTLTKAVSVPVTVSYGVEGVDEDDYESSSELTIPAGQRTGTIAIRTIDDELLEPEETMDGHAGDPHPGRDRCQPGVAGTGDDQDSAERWSRVRVTA